MSPDTSGDLRWYLEDVRRCLLPEDERPEVLPRARVHSKDDSEWVSTVRLLLERRVVEFVPDQRIPRHSGKRVLQGAFLVLKPGKFLPDGRPSGRLIMDPPTP